MNRCTRQSPCPVCGRTTWCCTDHDGGVYCMREHKVLEERGSFPPAGWTVLKRNPDGGAYLKPDNLVDNKEDWKAKPYKPRPKPPPKPKIDWDGLQENFSASVDDLSVVHLAERLGVSLRSLNLMGVGWCRDKNAWSFPMYGGNRQIIGMRLRRDDAKFAITGSTAGVFLPDLPMESWESEERVYVCEGPTDTAAVLTMGAYAVGRPSAGGGREILCELIAGKKAVIVADNDEPGTRGAIALADSLKQVGSRVKIVKPPAKDVRAWLVDGATIEDLEALVNQTKERRDAEQVQGKPT